MPAIPHVGSRVTAASIDLLIQRFERDFPQFQPQLERLLAVRFSESEEETQKNAPLSSTLSPEEISSIFEKVRHISQLPGLEVDSETQMYLEQQLEDMLGFGISTSSDTLQLPFIKGVADSLPHSYAIPGSRQEGLSKIKEAGRARHRPVFGWQLHALSQSATDHPYWVALPLRKMVSTSTNFVMVKKALFQKKVVLINPFEALCVVAEVLDEYTDASHKYQCGISPAVARHGLIWSPQNLGKILVFFITDPGAAPNPGVYPLL